MQKEISSKLTTLYRLVRLKLKAMDSIGKVVVCSRRAIRVKLCSEAKHTLALNAVVVFAQQALIAYSIDFVRREMTAVYFRH